MGPVETTGLVVVTVLLVEGLFKLVIHLINKGNRQAEDEHNNRLFKELASIKEKVVRLDDMHYKFDADGTPMWYVPRAWNETQVKIVDKLQAISQTELQILGIIERLERRIENLPG